jgi:hypothetical protein
MTPPPYGYGTPPPQQRDSSGSPLALILLAVIAVVGIVAAVLAATGVFSTESGSPTAQKVSHTDTTSGKVPPKKPDPKPPAGSIPCGSNGLWVNSVTTCPFAENTRSAYAEAGGAHRIQVYSPVTGLTYDMSCGGTSLVTCTGGNNAAVYFTAAKASGQNTSAPAPEPAPTPQTSVPSSGSMQACDQNISANEVTSCPFAENVFVAYWEEYESYGEESYAYVVAASPTTGETYGMECMLESDVVSCSGGNEAFVTFPMQAVREY